MSRPLAARAVACPNFALAKYWGKLPAGPKGTFENVPAVPSLSVTVDSMHTTTTVRFDASFTSDELVLNGTLASVHRAERAFALVDRVRRAAGLDVRAHVVSDNDFPTASGLASSASGFAALGLAAVHAAGLESTWDAARISDLVRRESASAARSVFGEFVELVPRREEMLAAEPVHAPRAPELSIIVCVVTEEEKKVSSSTGMRATAETSPYFMAWLEFAIANYRAQRDALIAGDFDTLGALAEKSALAMHAAALSAGLIYWTSATLEAMHATRALRERGLRTWFTIDAGPHVKVIVPRQNEAQVAEELARVPGVLRTLVARPGGAPRVEHVE